MQSLPLALLLNKMLTASHLQHLALTAIKLAKHLVSAVPYIFLACLEAAAKS